MSKVTFVDKTQTGAYDAAKWNAQDANEIKNAINAVYDKLPYKVYSVGLSQQGTNNPVAVEFINTTGLTFVFTRVSAGVYKMVASTPSDGNQVQTFICPQGGVDVVHVSTNTLVRAYYNQNDGHISITTYNMATNAYEDTILSYTAFEYRLYN